MSLFEINRVQWLPVNSLFGNMKTYHENHAHVDYLGLDDMLAVCLQNCTQFSEPELCIEYCHATRASQEASTRVEGQDTCFDTDCCKRLAGTNEFGYRECARRVALRIRWYPPNFLTHILFFFSAILFILVWIKCMFMPPLIPSIPSS